MKNSEVRRVLVVDDTPGIHADFGKILKNDPDEHKSLNATRDLLFGELPSQQAHGWHVDAAYQGEEGVAKVRQSLEEGRPYAVAFVDMRMPPGLNGIETTKQLWQLDPEILVVLCTAYTDFTWHEIVSQLGKTDRLLILKKPFESIEVRQMALALSERWNVARTDPLTRILNRRALSEHLNHLWTQAHDGEPLCCAMLDLDYFKRINDSHGHQAGDAVLVHTARLLRQHVRPQDIVARYGGEEFCVLLPGLNAALATDWAEEFRQRLKGTSINIGSRELVVTASIGIAERLDDTPSAASLVDAADNALSTAKRSGRNRVITQSSTMAIDEQKLSVQMSAYERLCSLNAKDVMTQPLFTLSQHASLEHAANLILQLGVHTMVVVDDDECLVGMLSETDALQAAMFASDWCGPVRDIMQTNVVRYDVTARVGDIAAFLMRNSYRKVVVTEQQKPVGTIGRANLMRWLANSKSNQAGVSSADQGEAVTSQVEEHVVELIRQLHDESEQLLGAIDGNQHVGDRPVVEHVTKMQEQLTEVLVMQRLASQERPLEARRHRSLTINTLRS